MYLRERKKAQREPERTWVGQEAEGEQTPPFWAERPGGTGSQDPVIMTGAKGKCSTDLSHPGAPRNDLFVNEN